MKILKWVLLLLAVALLGTVVISVGGWFMMRGRPEWYRPDTSTPEQRRAAASAAENKLVALYDWMAASRASARRAASLSTSGRQPSTAQIAEVLNQSPAQPCAITLTDQELNAFFNKWADAFNRREMYERYIEDPRVVLRDQQLILAGNVKEMGVIVSMQFEPKIDEKGNLRMNMVHVLGGTLPLPDSMWSSQREKIETMLQKKLTELQRQATIAADGVANGAAGSLAMNKLLWAVLHDCPADPVIFLPYDATNLNRCVPVKVAGVGLKDHAITLSAEQLSPADREGLLNRLRSPYPDVESTAREASAPSP